MVRRLKKLRLKKQMSLTKQALNSSSDSVQLSKTQLTQIQAAISLAKSRRKLELYRPYIKQKLFHESGLKFRERLFRAGNQLGKSYAGAAEAAIHATGLYPQWWTGRRWDKGTRGWASGVTSEVTRDTIQRLLIGAVGERGTGLIPPKMIHEVKTARGLTDLADTILVSHISGGLSSIKLKSYEQGREKFQADTIDWAWNDEEPDESIYTEILTRTNATNGILWTTFTPLLGMSNVVRRFLTEQSDDRCDINMTIEDAEHYTPEQRQMIINSYPAHEREARTKGVPILGSGRIFPIEELAITCEPFEIPAHWPQIVGLDFGWNHPTAAGRLAWDRDNDIVYVMATHRMREETPIIHAASIKGWGEWLPVAWPHDGLQHDKGSGEQLAEQYRKHGLKMLDKRATFEDGTNGVEAGLMDMLQRMQTGRFKVFGNLNDFFEEFRLYHRKDGKVVKEMDDIISSIRYGVMMLRFAVINQKTKPVSFSINSGRGSFMGA